MKLSRLLFTSLFLIAFSPLAKASLNLNIKIGQLIGNEMVESSRSISADYNKDIVISTEGVKNRIVLKFKKFSNIVVNGKKINPIQVDMRIINEMKKIIGKPQTVTSFYSRKADFQVKNPGNLTNENDMNLSLNFEEIAN